jgi:hypothetical protein
VLYVLLKRLFFAENAGLIFRRRCVQRLKRDS